MATLGVGSYAAASDPLNYRIPEARTRYRELARCKVMSRYKEMACCKEMAWFGDL
jgi:hypothetical protein